MYPSTRAFQNITSRNLLPNCPVSRDDIIAANDIFGSNLGSIKGKTVHRPGPSVNTKSDDVPDDIMCMYKNVILSIDIMFINKIPFFITISRHIHFGTVESIADRQSSTIAAALTRVISIYRRRGFHVGSVLADPEFEPLTIHIPDIPFNFCAQDEHVPDIE
jgi:hypothetical protein